MEALNQVEEKDKVREIEAHEVIVEVTDQATGKLYRRKLPIDYYETANFLKLCGENLDGSFSSLVFYTPRGMQRAKDITGLGDDHDTHRHK